MSFSLAIELFSSLVEDVLHICMYVHKFFNVSKTIS